MQVHRSEVVPEARQTEAEVKRSKDRVHTKEPGEGCYQCGRVGIGRQAELKGKVFAVCNDWEPGIDCRVYRELAEQEEAERRKRKADREKRERLLENGRAANKANREKVENEVAEVHFEGHGRIGAFKTKGGEKPEMSRAYCDDLSCLEHPMVPSPLPQGTSYSKSCPVQIELPGSDKPPLVGLAVLDDQASVSMVDPQVAEYFNIMKERLPIITFRMSTLEKKDSPHKGYGVYGLEVRPVHPMKAEKAVQLPTCITSLHMPEVWEEIPDPEDVKRVFGENGDWSGLEENFPKKDPRWTTLLLLGRNCKEAMEVKQFVTGCEGKPHAVETGLGWTLIGEHVPEPPRTGKLSGLGETTQQKDKWNETEGGIAQVTRDNVVSGFDCRQVLVHGSGVNQEMEGSQGNSRVQEALEKGERYCDFCGKEGSEDSRLGGIPGYWGHMGKCRNAWERRRKNGEIVGLLLDKRRKAENGVTRTQGWEVNRLRRGSLPPIGSREPRGTK